MRPSVCSGQPHAAIDACGHGFAQLDERRGTRGVAGQHDLRRFEHAVSIEQPTESCQRRVLGAFARRGEIAPQVAARAPPPTIRSAPAARRRSLVATPMPRRRSTPSSRTTASDRRSMCSMAATSSPCRSLVRQVACAASRSSPASAIAASSLASGVISQQTPAGRGCTSELGLDDDAERAFRADEQIDEIHPRRDVVARGSLRHIGHLQRRDIDADASPSLVSMTKAPVWPTRSPRRVTSPARRRSPGRRVSASTQPRIGPYLNVAAPAAFVEIAPPTVAPRNVGTGGSHMPCGRSASCSVASATPAPTVTRSPSNADRGQPLRADDDVAGRRRAARQR